MKKPSATRAPAKRLSRKAILAVDVGGTHVKVMDSKDLTKREFVSGPHLSAKEMVKQVKALTADWSYDVVSIGYPGPVAHNRPLAEPHNLGRGWVGFNFAKAFVRPTQVVNDALMQALGSYEGGRMLFLGLGTGRRRVADVVKHLTAALEPDYVILGGGNAEKLGRLPRNVRLGNNANAFKGGFKLWDARAAKRVGIATKA
jgi:polyphosphate glucokinase